MSEKEWFDHQSKLYQKHKREHATLSRKTLDTPSVSLQLACEREAGVMLGLRKAIDALDVAQDQELPGLGG